MNRDCVGCGKPRKITGYYNPVTNYISPHPSPTPPGTGYVYECLEPCPCSGPRDAMHKNDRESHYTTPLYGNRLEDGTNHD